MGISRDLGLPRPWLGRSLFLPIPMSPKPLLTFRRRDALNIEGSWAGVGWVSVSRQEFIFNSWLLLDGISSTWRCPESSVRPTPPHPRLKGPVCLSVGLSVGADLGPVGRVPLPTARWEGLFPP